MYDLRAENFVALKLFNEDLHFPFSVTCKKCSKNHWCTLTFNLMKSFIKIKPVKKYVTMKSDVL